MRNALSIQFKDTKHTDHLVKFIENKFRHLKNMHPGVMQCNVTVSTPHQQQQIGASRLVSITARIPGQNLSVKKSTDKQTGIDLYAAVSAAFSALENQAKPKDPARITYKNFRQASHRDAPSLAI